MDTSDSTLQRPLKVLFLTDCPISVSGGSERFLRNLVTHLSHEQFSISVVQLCEQPPLASRVYEASIPKTVDTRYLTCSAVYKQSGLRAYSVLRKRVLGEGFHIIQSQHENADFINALLPRGPLNAIRISNRRDTGFLKSPRLRLASRFLNHRYDRIIAPTNAILDAVAKSEHAPRGHMLCIPNGVDIARFQPADTSARRAVRDNLRLTENSLLVGCVADLFPVKRHIDLVDAFARVHEQFPDAHLLLVGDGPERGIVESRARERGAERAIHLLGSRKDIDQLLPALDLFVLASDTEGLSNAILEAQACGIPVVATNVGGTPDLVDDECGKLVAPRDPIAFADAMHALLRDPALRERMGAAARARVVRDHSLDAMTGSYAALYREHAHVR